MNRSAATTLAALILALPAAARPHCDTLDGPVVVAARAALEGGDPGPVLAWISPPQEAEIRAALAKARAARKAGGAARDVADTWFLETVVRVHRAGEGAPFTGLQPAGGPVEPAVAAVDRAVADRDPRAVEALLVSAVRDGLRSRWARLAAERRPGSDVTAGRRWVAAYVPLVHWAEGVEQAAAADPHATHASPAEPHADPHPRAEGHAEPQPAHAH